MSNKTFSITSDFKVKEVGEEENYVIIEGYANTTEKDRVGDVVLQEAWNKGGLDNYMINPIVLAFHDHSKPVGTVVEHAVDKKGLKVSAKIFKAAGNVYDFVKEGMLRTFSVGFRVKDADYDEKSDIFVIKDLELLEISVVSVPANAGSVFSVRKAFENDDAYTEFKEEFKKMTEKGEAVEDEVKTSESTSTDDIVKALEEKLGKSLDEKLTESLKKNSDELSAAVELLLEQKKEKENINMSDKKDEAQPAVFTKDMVEDLLKAAEERITAKVGEENKSLNDALEGLRGELNEKSAELQALQRNKMSFEDSGTVRVQTSDVDAAVMLSKAMKRGIEHTNFGKQLIEKAGVGPHLGSTTETWEEEFSMRLENDIREKLIMEPLFRKITMNAATMHIPVNPEAGYGEWIARTYPPLRSTNAASTGTAVDHEITDTNLTAHKLVAKEYLGDEEEEDSILPLMPIIRDAVMRRMAKAADVALLRGDVGVASPGAGNFPFNGVATIAKDATLETTVSIAAATPITVANLQTIRRDLGVWGLNPSELIYVVSHDVYYDLLEDPDFRTLDVVGQNATILRGQIGSVNGSPVVVSGEFATKANGAHAAVCLNAANFIVGQLRNTRVETDRSVEDQRNVIVASRRMGFLDLISAKGVSVLSWVT